MCVQTISEGQQEEPTIPSMGNGVRIHNYVIRYVVVAHGSERQTYIHTYNQTRQVDRQEKEALSHSPEAEKLKFNYVLRMCFLLQLVSLLMRMQGTTCNVLTVSL